jgi:hypothetical protein
VVDDVGSGKNKSEKTTKQNKSKNKNNKQNNKQTTTNKQHTMVLSIRVLLFPNRNFVFDRQQLC